MGRAQQPLALRLLGLDIEAQEIIVLDLELARLGQLAIFALQFGDDAPAFITQRARFIQRRQGAGAHETAVALVERQFVVQRRREFALQRAVCLNELCAGLGEAHA